MNKSRGEHNSSQNEATNRLKKKRKIKQPRREAGKEK